MRARRRFMICYAIVARRVRMRSRLRRQRSGDRAAYHHHRSRLGAAHDCSSGARASVREQLAPLLAATKADELMVTTMIHDHAARRRSYELLAQAFELRGA